MKQTIRHTYMTYTSYFVHTYMDAHAQSTVIESIRPSWSYFGISLLRTDTSWAQNLSEFILFSRVTTRKETQWLGPGTSPSTSSRASGHLGV